MKLKAFGKEVHFDKAKKGESWDVTVLIQQAVSSPNKADPEIKNMVVPYRLYFGWVHPLNTETLSIHHFIFFSLMVTLYVRKK